MAATLGHAAVPCASHQKWGATMARKACVMGSMYVNQRTLQANRHGGDDSNEQQQQVNGCHHASCARSLIAQHHTHPGAIWLGGDHMPPNRKSSGAMMPSSACATSKVGMAVERKVPMET